MVNLCSCDYLLVLQRCPPTSCSMMILGVCEMHLVMWLSGDHSYPPIAIACEYCFISLLRHTGRSILSMCCSVSWLYQVPTNWPFCKRQLWVWKSLSCDYQVIIATLLIAIACEYCFISLLRYTGWSTLSMCCSVSWLYQVYNVPTGHSATDNFGCGKACHVTIRWS